MRNIYYQNHSRILKKNILSTFHLLTYKTKKTVYLSSLYCFIITALEISYHSSLTLGKKCMKNAKEQNSKMGPR